MEIRLFHVQIVFCSMFQIKRKKVEEYLLTIYVFVYLCIKFKFRYLRSNGITWGKKHDFNKNKIT